MHKQLVDILDENGFAIGVKSKEYIDKVKDNLPVVYVIVYNSLGEVLIVELPGEDDKKNMFYQKYSLSAATLLMHDEDPKDGAKRALIKDFNIHSNPIFLDKSFFSFNNTKRMGYFFALKYDEEVEVNFDSAQKGEFVSREMIENMILQDPDIYTPSFLEFWNKFNDKLV